MSMDTTTLFLSVLFGAIGVGLLTYGKRSERLLHMLAGVGLIACPYVIPSVAALLAVGSLLVATPFLAGRR
ncbi:MAG: hypothetical protein HKO59_07750 [Phycisphaerales bacterium]|nr:hypothetical protein [Phycisphaerae bacterium]NNF42142.1 hypothetical protein [Phycisphaerales bacterium]NNM25869.1 hypothetical protein [Phycisphaerales bacterium]